MSFQNVPGTFQSEGARCAHHPESRAIATCTRCGNFICTECYRVGGDGEYYCFECDAKMPEFPAERGDRFVANLVDQFIVIVPWLLGVFVSGFLADADHSRGPLSLLIAVLGMFSSLGIGVYQLYLVSSRGQTIGKRMRNIRVVRLDGSRVSLGRILLLRNLVPGLLGSLCGLVSLIDALMIFGEERRCLHDLLADTKVVKVTSDMEEF